MISDQSQSAITGTKMSDSDLVSIAGSSRSRTEDGLEVTGHSPPASRTSTLAITGLGTFLIKSTCLRQSWKPVGKILNPTCTPTTPGGGTSRIYYLSFYLIETFIFILQSKIQ